MAAGHAQSAVSRSPVLQGICLAAAAGTVATHILWVLLPEAARDTATVVSVALFATASLTHAAATRGPRWAATYAAISLGAGWIAEAVGTTTGWPFGEYAYAGSLGPSIGPVPWVIPLAWTMMSYPVLLAARRTTGSRVVQTIYAAALLTAWDLFLDPQMVAEGHWRWSDDGAALPGVPGIPAQNFAGWFLVGLLLFAAAALLLSSTTGESDDRIPAALLLWVAASNVLANAAFWGRPSVALAGGGAMVLLLIPWLRSGVGQRAFWTRR